MAAVLIPSLMCAAPWSVLLHEANALSKGKQAALYEWGAILGVGASLSQTVAWGLWTGQEDNVDWSAGSFIYGLFLISRFLSLLFVPRYEPGYIMAGLSVTLGFYIFFTVAIAVSGNITATVFGTLAGILYFIDMAAAAELLTKLHPAIQHKTT